MSKRSDHVEEKDLDFVDKPDVLALKCVKGASHGAPYRFIYHREGDASANIKAGYVYAWVEHTENKEPWGKWEMLADMRFNSFEEIEAFMRNAARLGMDTGFFRL